MKERSTLTNAQGLVYNRLTLLIVILERLRVKLGRRKKTEEYVKDYYLLKCLLTLRSCHCVNS